MKNIQSIKSVAGVVDTVALHNGDILKRRSVTEKSEIGDFALVTGSNSFAWKRGGLYEIIELIGGYIPVAENELGFPDILEGVELVRMKKAEYQFTDGEVAIVQSVRSKGFAARDLVRVRRTAASVLHDYQITRWDGLIGFANDCDLVPVGEQGEQEYKKLKLLHLSDRTADELRVGDRVLVRAGAHAGQTLIVINVQNAERIVQLNTGVWLPLSYVEIVFPAELLA